MEKNVILTISNKNYPVKLVLKPMNKRIYLRLKNKEIVITTNSFIHTELFKRMIEQHQNQIDALLNKEVVINEDVFLFLGHRYTKEYIQGKKEVYLKDNHIVISTKANTIVEQEKALNEFIQTQSLQLFQHSLNKMYHLVQNESIPYPSLQIRMMKSKWGVCHYHKQKIVLNSLLLQFPTDVIDYVVLHELMHFIEPNHSKQFWTLVEKYMKDYKIKRKALKTNNL